MNKLNGKKVILLLSGGFDSTVAGKLLNDNGYTIIPVHLSNVDFAGEETINKTLKLVERFEWYPFYTIDYADALQTIVDKCKHSYYFILMKRLMLRVANKLVQKENAQYIATGESLGQVSSQTLRNIAVIEEVAEYRVLKPLITFDKEKIIRIAREINTYEISTGPEMCDILGPKHPIVEGKIELVLKEEENIDFSRLVDKLMENQRIIKSSDDLY